MGLPNIKALHNRLKLNYSIGVALRKISFGYCPIHQLIIVNFLLKHFNNFAQADLSALFEYIKPKQ